MTPKPVDTHKHTLKRAFKKVENDNGIRYMLFWVCTACKHKEAYDLVDDPPGGKYD